MHAILLNERPYTLSQSLTQDRHFEPALPYVFDLDYLGTLAVTGDMRASFLQGQVTCDVQDVTATHMRPGGMCSLQGRLLTLFDVIAWQETLHMIMPRDLLKTTQQRLAKPALFSRVHLQINDHCACLGLYLPPHAYLPNLPCALPNVPGQASQHDDAYCYAISEQLYIILLRNADHKQSWLAAFPNEQQRGSLAWHYLELQLPRFTIYPNTRDRFLPHNLQLHTTPYLSFNKGCYKGQEIIARMQYRAKLKHELRLNEITCSHPIYAGQKCLATPQGAEIGEIIDYCPIDTDRYLVAMFILKDHSEQVYFDHM